MNKTTIYDLNDPNLPKEFNHFKGIFMPELHTYNQQVVYKTDKRGRNESLHNYLLRKKIVCWCRNCRAEKKIKEEQNNLMLL